MSKWLIPAAALAALALPMLPAQADQYDGKWVVDFPAVAVNLSAWGSPGCPAFRLVINIQNDQISAAVARMPNNLLELKNSTGPEAEMVTGAVKPDGTFYAKWETYNVYGELAGDTGQAHVAGECGARTGTAIRIPASQE